ncbi:MAG: 30S ribosomal protein S18 [Patescibacteria group bacterium]
MNQCYFSKNNIKHIDYKNIELLKKFIDSHARIVSHKKSGVCTKHQRELSNAIKRARFLALLPYIAK